MTSWIESRANDLLQRDLEGVKRTLFAKALRAPTTHKHDFLSYYVGDLDGVVDMNAVRNSKIALGVDPFGGADIDYWPRIAEQYGLDLTIVNQSVDPTFRFMSVDWDGASGTSGMKGLVNGGLNLSELDGWWAEAYSPEVGWAIGDGREHGDDPSWDAAEAESLYVLLEKEVIPEFYARDEQGIPRGWIARMRESMARLTPAFSANRAVRQYTEEHYLSAAAAFRQRAENRDWSRSGRLAG